MQVWMIAKGVNLLDWSMLLRSHALGLYMVGMIGLLAFAVVYGFTAKQRKYRDDERMRRIQNSLDRLTRAAGEVYPAIMNKNHSAHTNQTAFPVPAESVLACKAATYASDELLERIDQYMEERDRKSLVLLYRTLDSDIRRLTRERKIVLARGEHPRWGLLLWLTIRPAIPFMVIIAESLLLWNLWHDLSTAMSVQPSSVALFAILRFISCTGALIVLYAVITADFRENARRLVFIWLALLISGLCFIHIFSLQAAPYLLIAQILIFVTGFRFTREPKRKERPFVGEYE